MKLWYPSLLLPEQCNSTASTIRGGLGFEPSMVLTPTSDQSHVMLIPPSDSSGTPHLASPLHCRHHVPTSLSSGWFNSLPLPLRSPLRKPYRSFKITNLMFPLSCLKNLKAASRINPESLTHLQGCLSPGPAYLLSLILCHFAPHSASATLALSQFLCRGRHSLFLWPEAWISFPMLVCAFIWLNPLLPVHYAALSERFSMTFRLD